MQTGPQWVCCFGKYLTHNSVSIADEDNDKYETGYDDMEPMTKRMICCIIHVYRYLKFSVTCNDLVANSNTVSG